MTTGPESQGPYCPEDGAPMVKAAGYGSLTYYRCRSCSGWTYDSDNGNYYSGIPEGATELQDLASSHGPDRELVIKGLVLRVDAFGVDPVREAQEVVGAVNLAIDRLNGSPLLDFDVGYSADIQAEYELVERS